MASDADDLLSIILPLYNRGEVVGNAIRSVLNQTYPKWELIVVDDCSTDDSPETVGRYSDERVKLLRLNENSGPASARNHGIKSCRGKYVSFLDSDDEYEPDFLYESRKKLRNSDPSIGFIWTGVRFIGDDSKLSLANGVWKPQFKKTPYLTLLHDLHIGTNSGISVKREVFDKVGYFDFRLKAAEDTDFFLRVSQEFSFDYIDKPLINIHRSNTDRLSKNYKKIFEAYRIIVPKHSGEITQSKKLRLKYYYKLMWLSYHANDKVAARKYFRAVLKDNKISAKAWFVFILFELLGHKLGAQVHLKLSAA